MKIDSEKKKEMDVVALKYFSLLEELMVMRVNLANILKTGFFSLSKAKYTMGTKSISPLQYPQWMQSSAILKIDCKSSPLYSEPCISLSRTTSLPTKEDSSKIRRRKGYKKTDGDGVGDVNDVVSVHDIELSEISNGNRRRKKNNKEHDDDDEENGDGGGEDESGDGGSNDDGDGNGVGGHVQKDPLLWFGVLVSPHLRQTQKDFVKATDIIVEIANITHQLNQLQQQYFSLQQTSTE